MEENKVWELLENQMDKKIDVEINQLPKEFKTDEKYYVSVKLSTLIKNYNNIPATHKKQVKETLTNLAKDNVNLKIDGLYLPNYIAAHQPSLYDFFWLFQLLLELGFSYEIDPAFIKYLLNRLEIFTDVDDDDEETVENHNKENKWLQPTLDKDINLQVKLAAAIVNSTFLRFNNLGEKAFIPKEEKHNQQKDEEDEKVEDEEEEDNTDTKKQKLEEN